MSTKPFTPLRRFSGYVLTLLLFCVSYGRGAEAQATTPPVIPSGAMGLSHPSGWGTIFDTVVDSFGDWLVVDYSNGALYEFPAGGGAMVTLIAPGGVGSGNNPGIAIDPNNDIFLEANWNNCLLMFPYDPAAKTWDGLSTITPSNNTADICPNGGGGTSPNIFAQYSLTINSTSGNYPGYFQPWGIAVDSVRSQLIIGNQNGSNVSGSKGFIFTLGYTGTAPNITSTATGNLILDSTTARPNSVAVDPAGDIFFVEDSGGLPGVLEVPAGNTDVASDAATVITRVDPMLPNVTGVTADANGNLYISDGTDGVFMVPNIAGTLTPSAAVMLTPIPAQGQVSIDWKRGILYVPTTQAQSNGEADVAEVTFNTALLGSTPAGTPAATPQTVDFSFNASETPGSFVIDEAGTSNPDFALASGGTCAAGTAQAAQTGCSVNVTLNPHSAGLVSANLVMLDGSGNTLATIPLNGIGTGSAIQVTPAGITTIDSGLKTPSQIAVDAAGNTYIADPGFSTIQVFAKGSSTATGIGTGLTAPTGVAVDGAGDVFIADSGNVIEIPEGTSGLNASGQVTLRSGLGNNLKLATDGQNDLYITDPDNGRVIELSNIGGVVNLLTQTETDLGGFTAPSALATDESGDLFVADGTKLIEVPPAGSATTLLNSLNNATGLAVDASGSVYVAQAGGAIRIPNEGGTLNASDATPVDSAVTDPTSVALDGAGDVYLTDGTAGDVSVVSNDGAFNFGTLTSTTGSSTQDFSILNAGNEPLNVSGFAGTADYTETANTCTSAINPGLTCSATITFNPGPGDQGQLTGEVLVQGDEVNAPVGINAIGVGAALADSTTTTTIGSASVDGIPISVTVAPVTGTSPTPTGNVTLTMTPASGTPIVVTSPLVSGAVQFDPTQVPAGPYTFTIAYQGDRVYGTSSVTSSVSVAPGAVTIIQPTMDQVVAAHPEYPYVLSSSGNQLEPYDGSQDPWVYHYPVQVVATDNQPLIGQPVYDSNGKLVAMNYGTITFQGAPYNAAAGDGCQPYYVLSDGTIATSPSTPPPGPGLDTECLTIVTGNGEVPSFMNSYTITPVYSPAGTGAAEAGYTNPDYAQATGTSISFTAIANPMVQIASNPSSLTLSAGSSATATITVSSLLGFGHAGINGLEHNYSLPVQLQCDGLPAYATCSFSYPNADPTDSQSVDVGPAPNSLLPGTTTICTRAMGCYGPGTVIMTITSNVPAGSIASLHRSNKTVFAAMLGLGMLALAFGRKKSLRERLMTMACLVLCCGVMAGINGCSTKQLSGGSGPAITPANTYTVMVTAIQVGSGPVTQGPPYTTYGSRNQVSLPFTMNVTIQ